MGSVIKKLLFDQAETIAHREELEAEYIAGIVREVLAAPVEIEIRLGNGATVLSQPYPTDACWDLYSRQRTEIHAHTTTEVPTGVYISVPDGFEGELKGRSSWGKNGLVVHHAVFDCGYQGELCPLVHNFTSETFTASKGDRVAQFCLRRKVNIAWKQVVTFSPSDRGTKGHGSSGR